MRDMTGSGNGVDDTAWREALRREGARAEADGRARLPDAGTVYARAMEEETAAEGAAEQAADARALQAAMRRALRPIRWAEWIGGAAAVVAFVIAVRWALRAGVVERFVATLADASALRAFGAGFPGTSTGAEGTAWTLGVGWSAWTPLTIAVAGAALAAAALLVAAVASPSEVEV